MHGGHMKSQGNVRVLKDALVAAFMSGNTEKFAQCTVALEMWLEATGNKSMKEYVPRGVLRERVDRSREKTD